MPAPSPAPVTVPGPPEGVSGFDAMTEAKLWRNPCWLAYRFNYLALRYNTPLYGWVRREYGLSRAEYVVLYSLALHDGGQARDITESSGFPKATVSRAIARLFRMGLIVASSDPGDGRARPLHLTEAGRRLYDETLPAFEAQERRMLAALTDEERATLSRLLARVVLNSVDWPRRVEGVDPADGEEDEP